MTKPVIEVPVAEPSNEKEFIAYCVYNAYFRGVEFFDTDEYFDTECNFAVEMDFSFEEYDDEDENSRWNKLLREMARQAHLQLADIHVLTARHNQLGSTT